MFVGVRLRFKGIRQTLDFFYRCREKNPRNIPKKLDFNPNEQDWCRIKQIHWKRSVRKQPNLNNLAQKNDCFFAKTDKLATFAATKIGA